MLNRVGVDSRQHLRVKGLRVNAAPPEAGTAPGFRAGDGLMLTAAGTDGRQVSHLPGGPPMGVMAHDIRVFRLIKHRFAAPKRLKKPETSNPKPETKTPAREKTRVISFFWLIILSLRLLKRIWVNNR